MKIIMRLHKPKMIVNSSASSGVAKIFQTALKKYDSRDLLKYFEIDR